MNGNRPRDAFALLATLAAVAAAQAGCSGSAGPPDGTRLDFDFRSDPSGWEADFTDFPAGRDDDVGFEAGIRELPAPLEGRALFHRGTNISDDLFMYFKHRVPGLEPGARYRASFRVEIASDRGQDCVIGGGNIYVKAGASGTEPVRVVDERGSVRLSVDKGNQRNSGENALLLGDIRNGHPGCGDEVPYATEELTREETITVSADDSGGLWLFFGSESAFEISHELFFTELRVTLREVGS